MKSLTLSPAAKADIDRIWDYSAERWGPDQADRYTEETRSACRDIAVGFRRGRPVEKRAGYLQYATGSHTIYFRERGDRMEVIRVLHHAQDAVRRLRN